jgi:hypothetical protein
MPNSSQIVVIGTGPCGYSTILGLLNKGLTPTVIDIGESGDSFTYSSTLPRNFGDLKNISGLMHSYGYPDLDISYESLPNAISLSGAMGGLGNIWGGGWQKPNEYVFETLGKEFLRKIQISSEKLLMHFAHSAQNDSLAQIPSYHSNLGESFEISNRISQLINSYTDTRNQTRIGQPRILLNESFAKNNSKVKVDVQDTQKMIFSPKKHIESLIAAGQIRYIKGYVKSILRNRNLFSINYVDTHALVRTLQADRVFLAAGAIASPMILQRSLDGLGELEVMDSQMFRIAIVSKYANEWKERLYSFPNAYIVSHQCNEEFVCSVIENSIQMSRAISGALPTDARMLGKGLLNFLTRHALGGIGFIPQESSGTLLIKKVNGRQSIYPNENPLTKIKIRNSIRRLSQLLFKCGMLAFSHGNSAPKVGSGFHSGSSFPMSLEPSRMNQSNLLGELDNLPNLHIVDSSSLPLGSHTFMAMSNAFRIAQEVS